MTEELKENSELVSVGEFPEPMEAEMVKLRLESAGIDTYMSGENAAILAPGLGPLEVQVRSEDEADARAIIADAGEGLADESLEEDGDGTADEGLREP
jgi:Putative prokaryotic signal transducing protein